MATETTKTAETGSTGSIALKAENQSFPPVVLTKTLHDFLSADLKDGEDIETLCTLKSNSDTQYGEAVPLSNKYIIHSAQVDTADDLAHLQLENTSHLLMFFAGPMNVIFLAAEGKTDDPTLSREAVDRNAKRSFGVIQESQRPKIRTFANIEDFIENHDGSKIRWGFGMDFSERLPSLFSPEKIYILNSKRWLAECDLRSANDEIIDCAIQCQSHQTKSRDHKQLWYYGGKECHTCAAGIEAEIERVTGKLKKAQTPYVLKLTQSLSSVGTMIVKDEDEKQETVKRIEEYLAMYLPRVTKENAYLYTTALILSEMIPGETMALNFYVRRNGSVAYLGACHQLATGNEGRQATAITYADQERLEPKYQKVLDKIGKVLYEEGYWGACGADIMEDKDGNMYTIDLNVRTPLSLVLYLLSKHFNDDHGLGVALVYECVQLNISRDKLESEFEKEFQEARIVLLGGTQLGEKEVYGYGMILAGEHKDAVDALSDRIMRFEA